MNRLEGTALDHALARAGDGVFVIGDEGRIILWNRAAERILGYAPREVLGRQCCEVFIGRDDKGNRLCYQGCHVMTLVRLGEPVQNFDMRTQNRGGQPIWLNISILTVPNNRPNSQLLVHMFRDVTASKELLTMVHERLSTSAPPAPPPDTGAVLTRREIEILGLLASGAATRMMAERLHVSPATVRNHVQNIFGKLGVHSRLEAVAFAHRNQLI